MLVSVGRRLVRCLRSQDTAARIGGDEFLILVDNLEGPEEAREVAERVLAALRPPVLLFGREVFVTASIGIAIRQAGDTSVDADDLVREADIAMYQAKAAGKAQAVLFDAGMDPPAVERLELETDLRRAVDRGELVLHFQPEIDLQTGALVGTEALVRWQHPQRGLVPPAEFIPIAEETGLIGAIGRWVLREACRQTQEWRALRPDGAPLAISVNLSARQLDNPGLVAEVAGILEETGLPPHTLRLEITETAAMHDADGKVAVLAELRALGVQLAIDDFGTGYSSLSYLQSLPVNILKIDRAFVSGVGDDPSAMAIVQAIIAVAHTLSLEVTAEGIETVEQLGHIAGLLCDRGQGFYFAKPMPPDALADILRRGATGEDIRAA
ncbi:MAG: bifunctional diguanylate cyclase/phosphodiesterase [Dehalococcoidia bacterium]